MITFTRALRTSGRQHIKGKGKVGKENGRTINNA